MPRAKTNRFVHPFVFWSFLGVLGGIDRTHPTSPRALSTRDLVHERNFREESLPLRQFHHIMRRTDIRISDYDYPLPEERIAKFPLEHRDDSKLLIYNQGNIHQSRFASIGEALPPHSLLVFNNTKVIRARLIFFKESGARIEIFCLEPHAPADYERAFAVQGSCQWQCIVGNLRKWKSGPLHIDFEIEGVSHRLSAQRVESTGKDQIVKFTWNGPFTFGQVLETLGRIPIPPYLNRESQEIDNRRYQTVYSKLEGSVAAPTAGLHFTPELIEQLRHEGHQTTEVTLHVGAGTFLPVKTDDVSEHPMHTEHFEIHRDTLQDLLNHRGNVVAVGTTSVRTLESLCALGYRTLTYGDPQTERTIGQWELYDLPDDQDGAPLLQALIDYMDREKCSSLKAATQILIMPGYQFRVVDRIITNFHQPKSTLLLLVSAFIGEDWRKVYDYALKNDFRFLSYGDSSLLIR